MSEKIKISSIDDSDRLRQVDPDRVAQIAQSIELGRLEQPLVVRPTGDGYRLIIGGHRLGAVKSIGWTELTVGEHVIIREQGDDDGAQLSEIDENLVRNDLDVLHRALFVAKRKALYLKIAPVRTRGRPRKDTEKKLEEISATCGFNFSERFTLNAARELGLSEDAVARAVKIAEALDEEMVEAIRGTRIANNQQELLALADLEPKGRKAAAKLIGSGEAKTVLQAKIALGVEYERSTDPGIKFAAMLTVSLPKLSDQDLKATLKAVRDEIKKREVNA